MIPTRTTRPATALTLALLLAALPAAAGPHAAAEAFARFQQLAGSWQGANAQGLPVRLTYRVVADGSAVLESLHVGDHGEMVTLYHLDGDRLLLSHYCIAGNQPRMQATAFGDDEVTFELLDATGLASAADGHMHRARFRFVAADRLVSEWTWREGGRDAAAPNVIRVERTERTAGR